MPLASAELTFGDLMHIFKASNQKWWQKPLVETATGNLPAELVILQLEREEGEEGVWLNSRSRKSGVSAISYDDEEFRTIRTDLPEPVSSFLEEVYGLSEHSRGWPDLVIWDRHSLKFRFVEVKCPVWDRPTKEQTAFMSYAESRGIATKIATWVFETEISWAESGNSSNNSTPGGE